MTLPLPRAPLLVAKVTLPPLFPPLPAIIFIVSAESICTLPASPVIMSPLDMVIPPVDNDIDAPDVISIEEASATLMDPDERPRDDLPEAM